METLRDISHFLINVNTTHVFWHGDFGVLNRNETHALR